MSDIDLTVAITLHAETAIAGPTMTSLERAIAAATNAGVKIELMMGFDTPKNATLAYFSGEEFSHWKRFQYEFRDQGKTRNALAQSATGKWLAFADGDDLFSENWFVAAVQRLKQAKLASQDVIVHPELNWVFDAGQFVFTKPEQHDPVFSPYYFYIANYYDALCVAPRDVWLAHPYADRAVNRGFAYEDWQWSIETMAGGWEHVSAKDTIIFKRRRDSSQTLEARSNSVWIRQCDAMNIDRISRLSR